MAKPPNKRQKTIAWEQFVKITINGKPKAQYKTCNALLGAKSKKWDQTFVSTSGEMLS